MKKAESLSFPTVMVWGSRTESFIVKMHPRAALHIAFPNSFDTYEFTQLFESAEMFQFFLGQAERGFARSRGWY